MPGIILPSQWRQQPQQAVPADRSNPYATGLVSLASPGAGLDAARNRPATHSGGTTIGVSQHGRVWQGSATYGPVDIGVTGGLGALAGTGAVSWFSRIYVSTLGVRQIVCADFDAGGTSESFNFEITAANQWRMSTANTAPTGIDVLGGTVTAGWHDIEVEITAGNYTVTLYVDGVLIGSSISAGPRRAGTGLRLMAPGLYVGLPFQGQMALSAFWSRNRSDAERAAIRANAWQLFQAPQRRLWTATAASGDGVGAAVGASTAAATGASTATASASATGTSTVSGTGTSTASATGSAAGTSTAQATGEQAGTYVSGAGSAAGTSTAQAAGASTNAATGSAAGTSTAIAAGAATAAASGSASGTSAVDGIAPAYVSSAGSASGTSTADGVAPSVISGTGNATGVSTVSGIALNAAGVFGGVPFFQSEQAAKYRKKKEREQEQPAPQAVAQAVETAIAKVVAKVDVIASPAQAERALKTELKRVEVAYQALYAKQLEEARNAVLIEELQALIQKDLDEQDEEEAMLLLM